MHAGVHSRSCAAQAKKTLVTLGLEDALHTSATLKIWLCNQKGRSDKAPAAAVPSQDAAQQAPPCLKTIKVSSLV